MHMQIGRDLIGNYCPIWKDRPHYVKKNTATHAIEILLSGNQLKLYPWNFYFRFKREENFLLEIRQSQDLPKQTATTLSAWIYSTSKK